MSLCLAFQHKDSIIIGADSRECIEENGNYYMTGNEFKKIHVVGNKLIFTSGCAYVLLDIISQFKQAKRQDIECLKKISIKSVNEYLKIPNAIQDKERYVELIVACFENGRSVIYNISSCENYKIIRVEGEKCTNTISLGCHTERAMELANKYINKIKNLNSAIQVYRYIYETLADEQLGGTLNLYVINNEGINFYSKYKIKDSRCLNACYTNNYEKYLNATDGIKIQNKSDTGDDWSLAKDVLYADTNGVLTAEDLKTKRLIVNDTNDNVLIDANTKKIDFSKFSIIAGNITADNIKVDSINADQITYKGKSLGNGTNSYLQWDENGNVAVRGNITMLGGTISWADISAPDYNDINGTKPPSDAEPNPSYITSTKITQTKIESPEIIGGSITGGSITSNSTIDVNTNISVGESVILNGYSASGGIRWGTAAGVPQIYIDPVTETLRLHAPGGVYSGNNRLDTPLVAKFG